MDSYRVTAAIKWTQRDFPVLPLRPNTKSEYTDRPDARGKVWYRPGATRRNATQDVATIRRWWTETPLANVGVIVSATSIVVDIDVRNGGLETMARFAWPETYSEMTASGGHHLVYRVPMRIPLSPFVVAPGVEILTEGTVFTSAPSSTDVGVYTVSGDRDIAACPDWLIEEISLRTAPTRPAQPKVQIGNVTSYGRAVLEREGLRIEQIPEGQRSAMLNLIVYHLARLIPSGALTEEAIIAEVERATASWKQPSKVANITRRAIDAGKLKPR